MNTITRVAPNGMKVIGNSRMLEIALEKANASAEKSDVIQQANRTRNYLRQRAYYERGLAMRASRGDTEAIAELAADGLTYQMVLNPNKNVSPNPEPVPETESKSDVSGSTDDGILGDTLILDD